MWLLIAHGPVPDAPYWPGRRLLAAVDALGWPGAWVIVLHPHAADGGLLVAVALAVAAVSAVGRLRRAVWRNHRYWFTTSRWGRVAGALLLFGVLLKPVLS